jgi:putative DNA primase/helicase
MGIYHISPELESRLISAAITAWGQPNPKLSKRTEYRWGNKGSKWLNLLTGGWQDHETGEKGNLRALLTLAGYDPGRLNMSRRADAEPVKRDPAVIQRICDELISPIKTPADRYLKGRGIDISVLNDLYYHRKLWHSETGTSPPAMVGLFRDVSDNVTAIHRTWLRITADEVIKAGVSPNKMFLGPAKGCSIHLAPAAPEMVIGEGIESTASAMKRYGLPGWAAGSTSFMEEMMLPDLVREVLITADNDASGAGERAAIKAAHRFMVGGRRVEVVMPSEVGTDFNDEEEVS